MNRALVFSWNYLLAKLHAKQSQPNNIRTYLANKTLVHKKKILSTEDVNREIYIKICSGAPFLAGRFGATELSALKTFDFNITSKYDQVLEQMELWSGFFPKSLENGHIFADLMLSLIPEADYMGVWMLPFETYYLNKYGSNTLNTTYLLDLEPWSAPDMPWTSALKGKKVLVIHPFAETIEKQYLKREHLFPGTDILPEFELKTLKAVQTIAGEKDERFDTWFDALDWMYEEALKIDFDIAIIGCGAYGFPLAAKLKQAGKQAIHLAGATQLLFGIKGKRWEDDEAFAYVQKYFNDAWIYPDKQDRPKNAQTVEGGCYWG